MTDSRSPDGVHGRSPGHWQNVLASALDARDHRALETLLADLGSEMREEAASLSRVNNAPLVDRLVEQARRVVRADPTHSEALETELGRERRIWADFRGKYRQCFIPAELHPFLKSSAVFLSPSAEKPQFEGFEKFFGCAGTPGSEAVTLFSRRPAEPSADQGRRTPPNFFCHFDPEEGRFTVLRAYRTDLPRGAGQECLAEQLRCLVQDPGQLNQLAFDKVQNRQTYEVFVVSDGETFAVRQDPRPDDAPLVRLGRRLIRAAGRTPGEVRTILDPYGFMDLIIAAM